jgi:branched-chain amino acid transport system ATP-binding protein
MKPLLDIKGISKSFGQLQILKDLSFCVCEGAPTSIIGPNGAGKTTLFNVITGRIPADKGSVFFDGINVTAVKPHVLSLMGVARSFQINNFFQNLTVRENLALSVQSRHKQRVSIWRSLNHANGFKEKIEEALNLIGMVDQADIEASKLSYGDQRKLEIGLALATEPKLLMLDEPTSGMSRYESLSMIDLIERLSSKVTIMLIEHDIEFVMKVSENLVVINLGEKIAEGTPKEIESNAEVQRVYLGGL